MKTPKGPIGGSGSIPANAPKPKDDTTEQPSYPVASPPPTTWLNRAHPMVVQGGRVFKKPDMPRPPWSYSK
jgi:hypothetical protein